MTIIGLSVGLFVGLVEGWTKTAWLLMRAGPLAGKQFVMFRDTTVLGSSPKAEVYLFKDEAIEPRHALIYNRGGRFEIEDMQHSRRDLRQRRSHQAATAEPRRPGRARQDRPGVPIERVQAGLRTSRERGIAMPITMSCPTCGKTLTAPDSAVGKRARCPGCGRL